MCTVWLTSRPTFIRGQVKGGNSLTLNWYKLYRTNKLGLCGRLYRKPIVKILARIPVLVLRTGFYILSDLLVLLHAGLEIDSEKVKTNPYSIICKKSREISISILYQKSKE